MSETAFDAVILAGGESSRMGQDKALLDFEGRPLLLRQMELARKAGAREVHVSVRHDGAYGSFGISTVTDDRPGCGPISGLIAGLRRSSKPLLLALAIDLPFVSPRFLRRLIAVCGPGLGSVPRSGNFFEPLAAYYPLEMLRLFEEARDKAEFGLQPVIHKGIEQALLRAYDLAEKDAFLLQNWNTPSSLRR
jgi:molybdenum cofactor guanylyltransferase